MTDYRDRIQELEEDVVGELNLEEVGVSNRYRTLSNYLRKKKDMNNEVRKQLHEYSVFLHLLTIWVDSSDVDSEKIKFIPSSGGADQFSPIPAMFVEPHLPPYPEEELWKKYCSEYHYLRDPTDEGRTHHTKPDVLLTVEKVDKLPWPANTAPRSINEKKLKKMAARAQDERLAEALGVDIEDLPDTYSECLSFIHEKAKKESPSKLYENWLNFQSKSEYIIECKHEPIKETDFSQILWYGLAYETDIIIISSHSVKDPEFSRDIENLPVEVTIVSDIDVHTDASKARSKLRKLL
jgi:hypothetical protein